MEINVPAIIEESYICPVLLFSLKIVLVHGVIPLDLPVIWTLSLETPSSLPYYILLQLCCPHGGTGCL